MIQGVYHGPKLQQSSPISVEKYLGLSSRIQYLFIPSKNKNKCRGIFFKVYKKEHNNEHHKRSY